MELLDKPIFRR